MRIISSWKTTDCSGCCAPFIALSIKAFQKFMEVIVFSPLFVATTAVLRNNSILLKIDTFPRYVSNYFAHGISLSFMYSSISNKLGY